MKLESPTGENRLGNIMEQCIEDSRSMFEDSRSMFPKLVVPLLAENENRRIQHLTVSSLEPVIYPQLEVNI